CADAGDAGNAQQLRSGKAFAHTPSMKKLHLSLSALAIGVILSANTCSDRENGMAGENLDMIKGKWELQSLEGTPVKMPAGIEQPYLSIDSTGKNLSGYGGCNRIFGEFKVSN